MSNPQDVIRDAILRHLHKIHLNARSPRSAGRGIQRLVRELKPLGYKQQQIASNLDYLVQKKWVKEDLESRTFTTDRGTTQTAAKLTYKISDLGIDRLEAASTYRRPEIASQVNITNIRGVTVVGEGNVLNLSFTDLAPVLNEMRTAVLAAQNLTEEQKLNAVADIEGLQAQIQKPEPNRSVVQTLWGGIEKIATAGALIELAQKVHALLSPLL